MKKNCAFQYYDGIVVREDITSITLEQAKRLWDKYYDDMIKMTLNGFDIEVAIWTEMKDEFDYSNHLIWLKSPEVINNTLSERKYYRKFK